MNTIDPWAAFFGNPVLSHYLEEADMQAQEQDTQLPQEPQEQDTQAGTNSNEDIEQLTSDVQAGTLDQSDLIDMYKSGKISKDEVQQIMQGSSEDQGDQEDQAVDPETGEPQLTEEELFAQQIDQTNDLLIKFALYDKITELTEKLSYFKDNFEDMQSDTYEKTIQLSEFLNILSNLVFNIETTVSYQMYGSILLQLTELFTEYNKPKKENIQQKTTGVSRVQDWANDNKSDELNDLQDQIDLSEKE